jgi:hypothetical protein
MAEECKIMNYPTPLARQKQTHKNWDRTFGKKKTPAELLSRDRRMYVSRKVPKIEGIEELAKSRVTRKDGD